MMAGFDDVATWLVVLLPVLAVFVLYKLVALPLWEIRFYRSQGVHFFPLGVILRTQMVNPVLFMPSPLSPSDIVYGSETLLPFFKRRRDSVGTIFANWMVLTRIHFVEPELVRQVLVTRNACFAKPFIVRKNFSFLGKGLLLAHGDQWSRQRRMINPAFGQPALKKMVPLLNQLTSEAVSQLRSHVQLATEAEAAAAESSASAAGGGGGGAGGGRHVGPSNTKSKKAVEVEMQELLSSWTLNIIGMAAFGAAIGTKGDSSSSSSGASGSGGSNGSSSDRERDMDSISVHSTSDNDQSGGEGGSIPRGISGTAHSDTATAGTNSNAAATGDTGAGAAAIAAADTAVTAAATGGITTARVSSEVFTESLKMTDLLTQRFKLMALPLYEWLPTLENCAIWSISAKLHHTTLAMVQQRRKQQALGFHGNDLLASMLAARDDETNEAMTDQQLIHECLTFLLAGHETTAKLLTWTMFLLARHPEWQDRLRAEIHRVIASPPPSPSPSHTPSSSPNPHSSSNTCSSSAAVQSGSPASNGMHPSATPSPPSPSPSASPSPSLSWAQLSGLQDMQIVLLESLRMFPPVPLISRECIQKTQIGPVTVLPGTIVQVAPPLLHFEERFWGSDAHEFKPERFKDGISSACSHPQAYVPFSFGPRNCIGAQFALVEAKVLLTHLLLSFSWQLGPSYQHLPYGLPTLRAKYGMPLVMEAL